MTSSSGGWSVKMTEWGSPSVFIFQVTVSPARMLRRWGKKALIAAVLSPAPTSTVSSLGGNVSGVAVGSGVGGSDVPEQAASDRAAATNSKPGRAATFHEALGGRVPLVCRWSCTLRNTPGQEEWMQDTRRSSSYHSQQWSGPRQHAPGWYRSPPLAILPYAGSPLSLGDSHGSRVLHHAAPSARV